MKFIRNILFTILAVLSLTALPYCSSNEAEDGDTVLHVLAFNREVALEVGESTEPEYFSVESTRDLTKDDIEFVSDDESVAAAKYHSSIDGIGIYYTIVGKSKGTTTIYFKDKTSSAISESITVTVTAPKDNEEVEKSKDSDDEYTAVSTKDGNTISVDDATQSTTEIDDDNTVQANQNATATYILNKNTKKFHEPSCSSAKKIKPKNYAEHYGSRDEAVGLGYSPCGICKP